MTTKIEWAQNADGTPGERWNPVTGCTKVSAGCKNCYAEKMHRRLTLMGQAKYSEPFNVVRFHPDTLDTPLRRRKPTTWFVNSMSDLFHEDLSFHDIARVFFVMVGECSAEPSGVQIHTFKILTKRPARMLEWFEWARQRYDNKDPEVQSMGLWALHQSTSNNLHLGVSVEDQKTADERIPLLLQTPAAKRFVSYEPALGPVGFQNWPGPGCDTGHCLTPQGLDAHPEAGHRGIDQIIVGGESGPGARPFNAAWARSVRDWCRAEGAACFVKQMGSNVIAPYATTARRVPDESLWSASVRGKGKTIKLKHPKGGDPSEWPEDLRVRELLR